MQVRSISHAYGRREVLNGVEFDLEPATLAGIVGENGAGKSALLKSSAVNCSPLTGP